MIYAGLGLLAAAWVVAYPGTDYYIRWFHRFTIKRRLAAGKRLCLTFDDGPDPAVTPRVLDLLRRQGVPAVFFLIGAKAGQYPELVKRIVAEGHEIGIHTQEHRHAYGMGPGRSRDSLRLGAWAVSRAAGFAPVWFRPPWGAANLFQWLTSKQMGLRLVLWSANAQDWKARTGPDGILARLRRRVKPGAVIVLHDAGGEPGAPENTLRALPELIAYFQQKGFRFVSLRSLTGGWEDERSSVGVTPDRTGHRPEVPR
jgi:peptidoglycan/xylan/chitin deacetylase (PgdA/CDA1 family)